MSSNESVIRVGKPIWKEVVAIPIAPLSPGLCTVTILFKDGSKAAVHYSVLEPFPNIVAKLGRYAHSHSCIEMGN